MILPQIIFNITLFLMGFVFLATCFGEMETKLRGFNYLGKVIEGVLFKDGVEVTSNDQNADGFMCQTPGRALTILTLPAKLILVKSIIRRYFLIGFDKLERNVSQIVWPV